MNDEFLLFGTTPYELKGGVLVGNFGNLEDRCEWRHAQLISAVISIEFHSHFICCARKCYFICIKDLWYL